VQQDSVLLRPGEAVARDLPQWRAWLPEKPMHRACPACLEDPARGFTLISQIPITLSCPEHGLHLAAIFGSLGTFIAWQDDDHTPADADPRVVTMDRWTTRAWTPRG
jgi:hypothetical protein